MTSGLIDPIRHNAWANAQMLAFCEGLTAEQLETGAAGTYGTIIATLRHIVRAEAGYLARIIGDDSIWERRPGEEAEIAELAKIAEETGARWLEVASAPFDGDRTIHATDRETGEPFDVKAGMLVAQLLNHSNEHRGHVNTIIAILGVEPPDVSGWAYGEANGRFQMNPPGR